MRPGLDEPPRAVKGRGVRSDLPLPPATWRGYARGAAFGVYATGVLAAWELHALGLEAPHRPHAVEAYKRRLARDALRLLGLRWEVHDLPPPPERARLVVANHRAAFDIGVMLAAFGGSLLSRGDLSEWPLVGRMARHGGTIFVDRGEAASGAAAIRTIRRRLAERGTVVVFPEGTTFPGDEVRPFSPGAFAAARGLDVEIVPVGLAYDAHAEWPPSTSFGAHVLEAASHRDKRVVGHAGTPFRPTGSSASVAEAARAEVQGLVQRSRALLSGSRSRGR